jgi:urease accessory protein
MKVLALVMVMISFAFGHTNVLENGGVVSGFLHPISGLDHVLAMIGVGIVASLTSNKGYLALLAFMTAMVLAAIAGYSGMTWFGIEEGILLSVAVIFALIGFAQKLSIGFIVPIVAFFGLFHGFAHGAEFTTGNFVSFIAGFSISTLALHVIGIAIGYAYSKKLLQPSAIKN